MEGQARQCPCLPHRWRGFRAVVPVLQAQAQVQAQVQAQPEVVPLLVVPVAALVAVVLAIDPAVLVAAPCLPVHDQIPSVYYLATVPLLVFLAMPAGECTKALQMPTLSIKAPAAI